MTVVMEETEVRPFGVDLMTPVGELVNGSPEAKTGYTTTYVSDVVSGKSQRKDDDEDE